MRCIKTLGPAKKAQKPASSPRRARAHLHCATCSPAFQFFKWSASNAAAAHGATALRAAFRQFDPDGTGEITASEFEPAASKLGFASNARDIFRELDADSSKTISYDELSEALAKRPPADVNTKQLLTAMMWSYGEVKEESRRANAARRIDTRNWTMKGKDVKTVRMELQALLRNSGSYIADLIKLFDEDNDLDLHIDDIEFVKAMRRFGFRGHTYILQAVFKSMDTTGDGVVGFDELFEFVRGDGYAP